MLFRFPSRVCPIWSSATCYQWSIPRCFVYSLSSWRIATYNLQGRDGQNPPSLLIIWQRRWGVQPWRRTTAKQNTIKVMNSSHRVPWYSLPPTTIELQSRNPLPLSPVFKLARCCRWISSPYPVAPRLALLTGTPSNLSSSIHLHPAIAITYRIMPHTTTACKMK